MKAGKTKLIVLAGIFLLQSCITGLSAGDSILYVDQGGAAILHTGTGETRIIAPDMFPEGWSPDGSRILLRSEGGIHVHDEASGQLQLVLALQTYPAWTILELAWLGDDHILAVVEIDGSSRLRLIGLEDGAVHVQLDDAEASAVLASPDGTLWLQRSGNGVEVCTPEGSRVVVTGIDYGVIPYVHTDTVFSPDGSRIAFLFEDQVWTAGIGPQGLSDRRVLAKAPGFTPDLAWSPDGRYLAWQAYDPESRSTFLRLLDVQTGGQVTAWPWPGITSQLLWSPGSDALLSFAGTPFVLDTADGRVSWPFGEDASGVTVIQGWTGGD